MALGQEWVERTKARRAKVLENSRKKKQQKEVTK